MVINHFHAGLKLIYKEKEKKQSQQTKTNQPNNKKSSNVS